MDSIWNELANLGINCTPVACLVSAAKLVRLIWVVVDSVKSNRAQCLALATVTKDILELISEKTHNQDAVTPIDQALISLETILHEVLSVVENQKQASLLKRIVKKDDFSSEIVRLYDRLNIACHRFGIKSHIHNCEQTAKQELARIADHADLMLTLGTSLKNDQILLDTLDLQHEQYLEAMAVMQRSLNESLRGALEVEFFKRGISVLSRRSRLQVPSPVLSWQITMFDDIVKNQRIGSGGAGQVHQGTWQGIPVAIKVLLPNTPRDMLTREIEIWNSLKHPNIVALYGASIEADPCFMVSKFYSNGNAPEFLRSHPAANKLRILLGVARGCRYLHSRTPPIIHGDLKGSNVLVEIDEAGKEVALITDFGLSRIKSHATLTSVGAPGKVRDTSGTLNWMAPERFRGKLNEATDVYAFAMTAWELLAGEVPWLLVPQSEFKTLIVHDKDRPDRPSTCSDELWSLIDACWAHEASERPTFKFICRTLDEVLQRDELAAIATARPTPSPVASSHAFSEPIIGTAITPVPKLVPIESIRVTEKLGNTTLPPFSHPVPFESTRASSHSSSNIEDLSGVPARRRDARLIPGYDAAQSIRQQADEHAKLITSLKEIENQRRIKLHSALALRETLEEWLPASELVLARSKRQERSRSVKLKKAEKKTHQILPKVFKNEGSREDKMKAKNQSYIATLQQVSRDAAARNSLVESYNSVESEIEILGTPQEDQLEIEDALDALYGSVLSGETPDYPENDAAQGRLAACESRLRQIRSQRQNKHLLGELKVELQSIADASFQYPDQGSDHKKLINHAYNSFNIYIKARHLYPTLEPFRLIPELSSHYKSLSKSEFLEVWKRRMVTAQTGRDIKKDIERDIRTIDQQQRLLDSSSNQELYRAERDVTRAVIELRRIRQAIFSHVENGQ